MNVQNTNDSDSGITQAQLWDQEVENLERAVISERTRSVYDGSIVKMILFLLNRQEEPGEHLLNPEFAQQWSASFR